MYNKQVLYNKGVIVGVCGTVVFAALNVWLFFGPSKQYLESDLVIVEGILKQADEVHARVGEAGTLQLWLRDSPLPFRSTNTYPRYYNKNALAELRVGARVVIGTPRKQETAPVTDYSQMQKFRDIITLKIGNHNAVSLQNENE